MFFAPSELRLSPCISPAFLPAPPEQKLPPDPVGEPNSLTVVRSSKHSRDHRPSAASLAPGSCRCRFELENAAMPQVCSPSALLYLSRRASRSVPIKSPSAMPQLPLANRRPLPVNTICVRDQLQFAKPPGLADRNWRQVWR